MPRLVPITAVIMISYEAITQPLITHSFSNIEIVLKSVSTTCPSKGQAQNWAKYQISAEYWGQSWPSVHLELTLLYIVWLFFLMSSIYFFHAWTIIFIKITHKNLASHPQKKKNLGRWEYCIEPLSGSQAFWIAVVIWLLSDGTVISLQSPLPSGITVTHHASHSRVSDRAGSFPASDSPPCTPHSKAWQRQRLKHKSDYLQCPCTAC